MVFASDLGSALAIVRHDYQDKISDGKAHQIARWKGLQDTIYEHGQADE